MQYPVRNKVDGVMYLQKGHFGIKWKRYLYALMEFVKGSSIEDTAHFVSKMVGENVSRTMIKETFRVNLFKEFAKFTGDEKRISFSEFCEANFVFPSMLNGQDSKLTQQKIILYTIYLREVFDLKPPLEIKN